MTERAAKEIEKAYNTYRTLPHTNQYMPITEIVNRTDLTIEEITAGVVTLMLQGWVAIPESNQKVLTPEKRKYRLLIGNQYKDLIAK